VIKFKLLFIAFFIDFKVYSALFKFEAHFFLNCGFRWCRYRCGS